MFFNLLWWVHLLRHPHNIFSKHSNSMMGLKLICPVFMLFATFSVVWKQLGIINAVIENGKVELKRSAKLFFHD